MFLYADVPHAPVQILLDTALGRRKPGIALLWRGAEEWLYGGNRRLTIHCTNRVLPHQEAIYDHSASAPGVARS